MSNSRGKSRTNAAPRKRNKAVIIALLVIVVLFVAAVIINSTAVRKKATAIEVNGMKFSASEYRFFYVSAVSEYTSYINSTFGESASSILPSNDKPLEAQTNPMTGQNWAEFYDQTAIETLQLFSGSYQEAVAAGHTVSDEDYAKVDEEITSLVEQVELYYGITFSDFINMQFGSKSGIDEAFYRNMSKKQYFANSYAKAVNDARTYTSEELAAYYSEHRDETDIFKYRYFTVRAENILNVADFESVEAYEEADKALIEEARAKAADYVATITDEQDFIQKARELDSEIYEKEISTLNHTVGRDLTTTFAAWAKDPVRKLGDMCSEPANEDESANRAFFVVFFNERLDNKYPTANIELLLLTGQTINSDDYMGDDEVLNETAYNAEVEHSQAQLKLKADELFAEWEANGGTVEYIKDYAEANTSVIYGSLEEFSATLSYSPYENLAHSYNEDDLADAWMHDPARKPGDIAVVASTNPNSYFLMYYTGLGMNYCDYLADSAIREEDRIAWEDSFIVPDAVHTRWGMKLI